MVEHGAVRVENAVAPAVFAVCDKVAQDARSMGPEVDPMVPAAQVNVHNLGGLPSFRKMPDGEWRVGCFSGRALHSHFLHRAVKSALGIADTETLFASAPRIPDPPPVAFQGLGRRGEVLRCERRWRPAVR